MKTVYITRKLPDEIIKKLSSHYQVKQWEQEHIPVPRDVLLKEVADADALYCVLTENIDEEIIKAGKKLKIISNMAVGYNNIDVKTANSNGIIVTNTPGVLTETTADLTFALLMATARGFYSASNVLREGNWGAWSPLDFTGQDIHGATLGIIGLGRIGEAVAKRAKGFDMNVLYYNRSPKKEVEEALGITYSPFEKLLQRSDYVCLLLPYSKTSHHLIGKNELALMKTTAVLINSGRGGLVDEQALYEALKNKQIWAAGLDVFEQEPVDPKHPLLTLPNVVALPHIGSASIQTRMKMALLAADNIIEVLSGNKALTEVIV